MANLNNLKSGLRLFLKGYLSWANVLNMSLNQVLYALTAGYMWLGSILRRTPGLMKVKSKSKNFSEKKRVLISFVFRPLFKAHFIGKIRYYFSINGLTLYLIRAFNELGYDCDVIDLTNRDFKVRQNYNAAVFHVGNFDVINPQLPTDCVTMAFETGAYWRVHNAKEKERFDELKQRRGASLSPDRYHNQGEQTDFMLKDVSAIIALGDNFTRETFRDFSSVYPINSAYLEDYDFSQQYLLGKDFEQAKRNFIYFGGGGQVHKGLDLLIETFFQLPDLELYLCCTLTPEFLKIYDRELAQSPNIHIIGYLPQRSRGFYRLMQKCAFNVHVSCSEGSPGGVIEVLQYGIIPVVSYESNIVVKDFGVTLKNHSIDEIKQTVAGLSDLPAEEIKRMALATRKAGEERFTTEVFLKNLKNILKDQIKIP